MDDQNENTNNGSQDKQPDSKKPKKRLKPVLKAFIIFIFICLAWVGFSMIGRVNAASVIPDSASLRVSIANPINLLDNILAHESLEDISTIPALVPVSSVVEALKENKILKNGFLRFIARGNMELALLPQDSGRGKVVAAWDLKLLSPLLRILPVASNFITVPHLYYVQAGSNSRFEFRTDDMTLYIGPYRNLLFITDNAQVFESRSAMHSGHAGAFGVIKPSSFDAALMLSNEFIAQLLSEQDPGIAELINNIEFDTRVEAGLSIFPRKIELRLAAPLSSRQSSISRILAQRSQVPGMAERIPADAQYAAILSAGTLEELYQAALVFTPGLDEALRTADSSSRMLLGLTLNDLLFSWSGNEFAAFALEGRPHPVYAIQINDERKRQEVFNRAFRSIVLNENVRLNLDGTRIPRIEVPEFLQSLLRRWDVFVPSPYYIIHRDYMLVSESAEALLSAVRAIQRNDVLPRTAEWRNIAGGRTSASSFNLYYSLDLSIPFFLRKNTAFSGFLSLYRQGLVRMSFDRGVTDISFSLVPGSGNGVTLVNGYPISISGRPSNRVFGTGRGEDARVFFSSGSTAFSIKTSDNSIIELSGQGTHWIIPADGINTASSGGRDSSRAGNVAAWVVTDRGRVSLVDGNMEIVPGFPVLLGLRLSAPPVAYEGKLYLCDEGGKVYVVDERGSQKDWETSFNVALRSPPSFLSVSSRRDTTTFAAVYPKSFFGEIWLLDANGKAMPNWPAPIAVSAGRTRIADNGGEENEDIEHDEDVSVFGIGFGSPLLFAHNNRLHVAFINQSGQLLVYDERAEMIPPFPINLDGIFFIQPVYDGEFLWLASSNGTLFRVDFEGEVLSQQIPGFAVMEEGYITVFDSNNDKTPEVFITGDGNALHGYTRNFRSLENFPLPVWGRPYFVPAQGNRRAEVFGIGMSMRLYRWQFK